MVIENNDANEVIVTEEVNTEDQIDNANVEQEELDPMFEGLAEAEAEIATYGSDDKVEDTNTETEAEEAPAEKVEVEETKDNVVVEEDKSEEKNDVKMVPLARLNQVLSEKKQAEENAAYLKGVVDTQNSMKTGSTEQEADNSQQDSSMNVNTYDDFINKAEQEILKAAELYDNGDMTTVEFETIKASLNRDIRQLNDVRSQEMLEEARKTANTVVSANNLEAEKNRIANDLNQQHPYVAAIDALPKNISQGIWAEIKAEAHGNLVNQGHEVNIKSVEGNRMIMQEMAKLTDKYGPKYAPGAIVKEDNQEKTGGLSDVAKQREAKLNLSEQQPPEVIGSVEDKRQELTEADIETMDQDELADMLSQAPQIILKAAGMKNR